MPKPGPRTTYRYSPEFKTALGRQVIYPLSSTNCNALDSWASTFSQEVPAASRIGLTWALGCKERPPPLTEATNDRPMGSDLP